MAVIEKLSCEPRHTGYWQQGMVIGATVLLSSGYVSLTAQAAGSHANFITQVVHKWCSWIAEAQAGSG
jgi:hypothetical protein